MPQPPTNTISIVYRTVSIMCALMAPPPNMLGRAFSCLSIWYISLIECFKCYRQGANK